MKQSPLSFAAVAALTCFVVPAARAQVAPGWTFTTLASISGGVNDVTLAGDGNLYGTSRNGGATANGSLWKYDTATNNFSTLGSFNFGPEGVFPLGSVAVDSNGMVYGTSQFGGDIWRFNQNTSTFTNLFTATAAQGFRFTAGVDIDAGGVLRGTTEFGGVNNVGVYYTFDTTTNTYTKVLDFAFGNNQGARPHSNVNLAPGGITYGVTEFGGSFNEGTLWRQDAASGAGGVTVFSFVSHNGQPSFGPLGSVVLGNDGVVYGTTQSANNGSFFGSLWKFDPSTYVATPTPNTGVVSDVAQFTGTGGAKRGDNPTGGLALGADGNIYGTTRSGGANDLGTIFQFNPSSGTLTTLVDFTGDTGDALGQGPIGNIRVAPDGTLYGTSAGTLWRLTGPAIVTAAPEPAAGALSLVGIALLIVVRRRRLA